MDEFRGSQNYVADPELLRAVNIAMVLQKPLLIKGEPGTGKTMPVSYTHLLYSMAVFLARMVMPRSRSRSLESMTRSTVC